MRVLAVTLAAGVTILSACSSVPDVQYLDIDGGGTSVRSDAGGSSDGGGVQCPDKPPSPDVGVCCGKTLCVKCKASQCSRCVDRDCDGNEVCCARNAARVECTQASACD